MNEPLVGTNLAFFVYIIAPHYCIERTVNFPWLSCFFFKMTRKVIILTKRRRPSAAVQRAAARRRRQHHGISRFLSCTDATAAAAPHRHECRATPPRSIPLTSSSFVPTYCWFEAYMQCAVCSRPLDTVGQIRQICKETSNNVIVIDMSIWVMIE